MQEKNKTVWRLYSGATWTLNELADVLAFSSVFVGIGIMIGFLLNALVS